MKEGFLFVSDDGVDVMDGDPIFIQAKDCGFYEAKKANKAMAEIRLLTDRPYHWNVYVNEEMCKLYKRFLADYEDYKRAVALNGKY